ncbi:MAG TPA: hypothetical protein VGF86_07605 [Candidatus Tumulicola sp.]|jgi:hypothetical protein
MTKLIAITFGLAVAALSLTATPGSAQSMMSAMPKCAAGDSVVGVNMNTKVYMTQAQMKAKSAGMTMAQKEAMMKKNNVKMMCQSAAVKMGAKPAPSSM